MDKIKITIKDVSPLLLNTASPRNEHEYDLIEKEMNGFREVGKYASYREPVWKFGWINHQMVIEGLTSHVYGKFDIWQSDYWNGGLYVYVGAKEVKYKKFKSDNLYELKLQVEAYLNRITEAFEKSLEEIE